MQVFEFPDVIELKYLDGEISKRKCEPRYCFSTGYKDLDEFLGITEIINNIPIIRHEQKTDFVTYKLDNDKITYTCAIDNSTKELMINKNTMSRIKKIEEINSIKVKNPFEMEDDELYVHFQGINQANTSITVVLVAKKIIHYLYKKEIKVENLIGLTYEDIFQTLKSNIKGVHVATVSPLLRFNYYIYGDGLLDDYHYELFSGNDMYSLKVPDFRFCWILGRLIFDGEPVKDKYLVKRSNGKRAN